MNLKEAKRLQPGAIVRESWGPEFRQGIVLAKSYVKERHMAVYLSRTKDERYDVVVHWLCKNPPRGHHVPGITPGTVRNPQTRQSWELMVIAHAS